MFPWPLISFSIYFQLMCQYRVPQLFRGVLFSTRWDATLYTMQLEEHHGRHGSEGDFGIFESKWLRKLRSSIPRHKLLKMN